MQASPKAMIGACKGRLGKPRRKRNRHPHQPSIWIAAALLVGIALRNGILVPLPKTGKSQKKAAGKPSGGLEHAIAVVHLTADIPAREFGACGCLGRTDRYDAFHILA